MTARMTIPLCLFLALAASACGSAQTERGAQPPGPRPPAVYTVGRTLLGLPGHDRVTLAAAPVTPLAGWLTPVAVPSPDGRFVAYNTWRELREDDPALSWEDQGISAGDPLARPSIRLRDLQTGTDSAYVVGAFSLAWREDGAIAYFKGADRDYRAGVRYVGDVFVRDSVNAPAPALDGEDRPLRRRGLGRPLAARLPGARRRGTRRPRARRAREAASARLRRRPRRHQPGRHERARRTRAGDRSAAGGPHRRLERHEAGLARPEHGRPRSGCRRLRGRLAGRPRRRAVRLRPRRLPHRRRPHRARPNDARRSGPRAWPNHASSDRAA